MEATKREIKEWAKKAQEKGCSHLVIVIDQYGSYPVFITAINDIYRVVHAYSKSSTQRVDKVYSFTGKYSIDSQLKDRNAKYLD